MWQRKERRKRGKGWMESASLASAGYLAAADLVDTRAL